MIGALATGLLLYRRELGISQEKFAAAAGLGVASVKRWETGKQAPGDAVLTAVAAGFGMRPSELLVKLARMCAAEEKRSRSALAVEEAEPSPTDVIDPEERLEDERESIARGLRDSS